MLQPQPQPHLDVKEWAHSCASRKYHLESGKLGTGSGQTLWKKSRQDMYQTGHTIEKHILVPEMATSRQEAELKVRNPAASVIVGF